jgi:iron-sulfur cluster repair protein YtfE (RIC family)
MNPSQVRAELLGEHFELRRLVEAARVVIEKGSVPPAELASALDALVGALAAHAKHEEAALIELAESLSESARKPNAVMDEDHIADHERLVASVRQAGAAATPTARRERVGEVLAELESHMTSEEAVLLGEDLLVD